MRAKAKPTAATTRLAELVERVAPGVAAVALGADTARRGKLAAKLRASGAMLKKLPRGVPWRIRGECLAIAQDGSGRIAWRYLLRFPHRLRLLLLRICAELGGARSRQWIRTVQCAWATWRLMRPVKVRSRSRGARFFAGGKVCDGYSRGVWNLLVLQADGTPWSHETLWGTHNGRRHLPGPMARLDRAGLWTRRQPPARVAQWVGPSGFALGQMWMGRRNAGTLGATAAERQELAELDKAHRPPGI